MTKLKAVILCGLVVVITSFCYGCSIFPKEEDLLVPPLVEPPKITYDVLEVKKSTIENKISGFATVISVAQETLSFRNRSGFLKSMNAALGDMVQEGDVLAELDKESLESQIQKQELTVQKLYVVYQQHKEASEHNWKLEIAEQELELAKIQYNEALKAYNNVKELSKKIEPPLTISSIYSNTDLEKLETQVKRQESNLRKAELEYEEAYVASQTNVEMQRAHFDLEIARSQLDDLKKEFEKSKLVAPFSGKITYVGKMNAGDSVKGSDIIYQIADPNQLQLEYSGKRIDDFKLGVKVVVTIDKKVYEGEVVMNPSNVPLDAPDSMKKIVRIVVKDLPTDIAIGSYGYVDLILERRDNTIVLPRSVVHTYKGRNYVNILEDNIKKERDVEIGIESSTEVEIVKGLKEGEEVILR